MSPPTSPPPREIGEAPNHTALCVAAFLTDRRCKRLLRRLLDGTLVLTLQLNEMVLEAIGHDKRGWRDWTSATTEALNIVMNLEATQREKWHEAPTPKEAHHGRVEGHHQ